MLQSCPVASSVASSSSSTASLRRMACSVRVILKKSTTVSIWRLRRRPAVSIRISGTSTAPSRMVTGTSMASRVVPAISLTITRSAPKIWLTREDLPTFGRPTTASFMIGSGPSVRVATGSSAVTASMRSRMPRLWVQEVGTMVLKPRRLKSASAALARVSLSALLAAITTGRCEVRRKAATSSSWAVMPVWQSTTQIRAVASSTMVATCSRIRPSNRPTFFSRRLTPRPPVSTRVKWCSPCCPGAVMRSRVTPASSCTMAIRRPMMQLNSADLPTLGRPTMTTSGT